LKSARFIKVFGAVVSTIRSFVTQTLRSRFGFPEKPWEPLGVHCRHLEPLGNNGLPGGRANELSWRPRDPGDDDEEARVHRGCRECGGMAASSMGAAAQDAADRCDLDLGRE
jgi:hypothetical protein